MSGIPALSPSRHQHPASRADGDVLPPRPVEAAERPVDSPVHALQRKLARLEPSAETGDSGKSKLPCWLRLTLPLVMSIGLWFVIIRFIGALWFK